MVERNDWWRIQIYIRCRLHFRKPKFKRSSKHKFSFSLITFRALDSWRAWSIILLNFCNCTKLGKKNRTALVQTLKEEWVTSFDSEFCAGLLGVGILCSGEGCHNHMGNTNLSSQCSMWRYLFLSRNTGESRGDKRVIIGNCWVKKWKIEHFHPYAIKINFFFKTPHLR